MKLKKKLFDQLQAEKQTADAIAFNYEVAINALQNLCDHEWIVDEAHGFSDDSPYCKICGVEKNKINSLAENRKDETFS